ncbi:hypothetical protein CapIbe_003600 [Capra ibex]
MWQKRKVKQTIFFFSSLSLHISLLPYPLLVQLEQVIFSAKSFSEPFIETGNTEEEANKDRKKNQNP